MSASFRMLWVCARGRWRIQGEKKVYVFRKTFLFLPLDAVEVTSSASAHGAGLSWEPGTIPAPALLLSQLGLAWCSSVSPELCSQGPSAHLPFCDTARTDGISLHDTVATLLLLPGLMPGLGCLGLGWMWTLAVFQVSFQPLLRI